MSELDGTMVCDFDLKKSRNDWRIWVLVIILKQVKSLVKNLRAGERKFFAFPASASIANCQLLEVRFLQKNFLNNFARGTIKESEVSALFEQNIFPALFVIRNNP